MQHLYSFTTSGAIALLVLLSTTPTVLADRAGLDDGAQQPLAEFGVIISQIAAAEASGEWKTEGWADRVIQDWLHGVASRIASQTKRDFVKLPVEFKNVAADAKGDKQRLYVAKSIDLAHVGRSIILVDGDANISHVNDSVIIAKGSVRIAHSNRCLVVAGGNVHVSHDGNDAFAHGADPIPGGKRTPLKDGSTILSGRNMDIGHAQGTICSAPTGLSISHARQVVYLNTPKRKVSWEHEPCQGILDALLPVIAVEKLQK